MLRPDGSACEPGEEGELVHRGPLVALGYWNDPERTAERFRPLPGGRLAVAGARRVVRRHGGRRRGGLPLLRRPHRRDDQDLRLPGEPHRDRGGRVRDRDWCATPSRSACPTNSSGTASCSSVAPHPGDERRAPLPAGCAPQGAARSTWCPAEVVVRDELPRSPNGKFDRVSRLAHEIAAGDGTA